MTKEATSDRDAIPKKWLITGGCGFIGTSLIRYLRKKVPDARIRVMDNLTVGTREDLSTVCEYKEIERHDSKALAADDGWKTAVQLVVADIKDADACISCTQGMEAVVHLAANTGVAPSVENPRADMEANVVGTFNMLEASRQNGVGRFVLASSGAPIGEVEPPIHEELAPHPVSPYGASKLACEGYCSAYYRSFGLETVALRFGNVYGPGSKHKSSVVAKFIKQSFNGETLEIYGDGKQTRDFVYIDDLSRAILLAASRRGIGGEAFQIATNSETTVAEVVELLKAVFEKKGLAFSEVVHSAPRVGDVKRNFSDTSKAKKSLGWTPLVALPDGIEKTVDWFG
ncbi:NAD-dependent epimerase/dehydratase family protein [uncultured Desulfosarcina sp.]|uniref:NAD-dependent epimerase/dehydratase family protein n=1 Tax=uncultured Desulfosarcina sp. TaxID=218289 RepID=UPI0029C6D53A|nr:NAD-dependent epimerase/dehydratase family protein [uncultured Desulfosarcina sp.]